MKKLFFRLSLACLVLMGTVFAAGPWINISPSIAGKDIPVRVSGLLENENLSLLLVRPDESKISIDVTANDLGVASFSIYGLHVRQAGSYELLVRREQSSHVIAEQFFVSPSSVSAYRSTQSVDISSLAADGEQVARIRVQAKDPHGNVIVNAPVRAFSSRAEDSVVAAPETNEQGEVIVKVSSNTPGVSSISVLVGDVLLFERTELVFHLANTGNLAMGASGIGKFLQAQLFEDPKEEVPVAYFSIEDLESEIVAGENMTVRVGAKDADGAVVANYTGTIRFSSSDDRAVLPNDYTFVSEDQGWHTFYLSVMLQTPGMQTIAVHDLGDFRISGERNVTVSDSSGVVAIPDPTPEVRIDVPVNGSTFSSSRITISGTAVGTSLVRLTDGPTELISALPVDSSGKYVYQTPRLAEGIHLFQATSVEDPTVVSEVVQVTIDRSPSKIMSLEIVPKEGVSPGMNVLFTIEAEDELSSVSVEIDGQKCDLEMETPKVFSKTCLAPFSKGEYSISTTLIDLLGNKITDPNAGTLLVEGFQGTMELIPEGTVLPLTYSTIYVRSLNKLSNVTCQFIGSEHELETKDSKNFSSEIQAPESLGEYSVPCTMTDLQGNKTTEIRTLKVGSLSVELDPTGSVLPLTETTILAQSFGELSSVSCGLLGQTYNLTSSDSKNFSTKVFAPAAQGIYPVDCVGTDLQGNQMVDTQMLTVGDWATALDSEGEIPALTEVIASAQSLSELASVNCEIAGKTYSLASSDSKNFSVPFIAPETSGVYPVKFIGMSKEGVEMTDVKNLIIESSENIPPLPASSVHTLPGEKRVTVLWSPAVDDKGIKNYRINFGKNETTLFDVNLTPDARTQWYVDGLEPCVEMYFQVTPIDQEGLEGPGSIIVAGTPFCDKVEHPAPPKTGNSTSWWFAVFAIITGLGMVLFLRHRS